MSHQITEELSPRSGVKLKCMDTSREIRNDFIPNLIAGALFLCIAVSLGAFLTNQGDFPSQMFSWQRPDEIAAAASPIVFLCACILVVVIPHSGYVLGLVGCLLALPLFVRMEISLAPWNSWIFLNQDGSTYFRGGVPLFAKLRILAPVLIVIALTTTSLRLLPGQWLVRKLAWRTRTWPALAVAFFVLTVWFVHSAVPYSVAAFDHPSHFEFRILHVQKRGLSFHETRVSEYRDARVWIFRHDRRLLQYRFGDRVSTLALGDQSPAILERVRALVQSPALWKLHTQPTKALWSWDAEGWFVVLKDSKLLAFTSEYGTAPPPEVTALFHEIEQLPASSEKQFDVSDVCLGFCYDPLAALGFSVLRQRTKLLAPNHPDANGGS